MRFVFMNCTGAEVSRQICPRPSPRFLWEKLERFFRALHWFSSWYAWDWDRFSEFTSERLHREQRERGWVSCAFWHEILFSEIERIPNSKKILHKRDSKSIWVLDREVEYVMNRYHAFSWLMNRFMLFPWILKCFIPFHEYESFHAFPCIMNRFVPFPWIMIVSCFSMIMKRFMLFHELWTDSCFSMNYEPFHAFPWTMNRFIFMHFHESEKSSAAAEQAAEQFSNGPRLRSRGQKLT